MTKDQLIERYKQKYVNSEESMRKHFHAMHADLDPESRDYHRDLKRHFESVMEAYTRIIYDLQKMEE